MKFNTGCTNRASLLGSGVLLRSLDPYRLHPCRRPGGRGSLWDSCEYGIIIAGPGGGVELMSRLYDPGEYDKHMSLKVDAGLWLVILYLLRPFLVVVASRSMGRGGSAPGIDLLQHILYPDSFSLWTGMLTTAPVIVFIFAWSRRNPGASEVVQVLWKHGAGILATAAAMNIAVIFVPLLRGIVTEIHTLGWVQLGIAVYIIIYLFTSHRVRDTFADFPAESN